MVDISDPTVVQTEDICMKAVNQDWCALEYVKNQTEEICICAVKQYGRALKYVRNQTDAICLCAVTENGYALKHVHNQTDAICMKAVKQNGYALEYVHNQTDAICLEALKSSRVSDWYDSFENVYDIIKYPSPQLINQLVKLYPSHINSIIDSYAQNIIATYKTSSDTICAYLVQHANDLLYKPNSVNALASHTKWHAGQTNAKTVFLTKS